MIGVDDRATGSNAVRVMHGSCTCLRVTGHADASQCGHDEVEGDVDVQMLC